MSLQPEHPPRTLTGQVALVTGGGRGIGRAIAVGLAGAGAHVAIVARTRDQLDATVALIEQVGGCARAIPADVSDPAAVAHTLLDVEQSLGPVDLLVNNAGVAGPIGPFAGVDPEEWWRCQEVNLRGPLLYTRAVLPGMIARGRGRVVNVASGAGTQAIPNLSAYVVSKAALIRLTEIVAAEVATSGIVLFAIEPGTVRTAMAESVLQSEAGRSYLPWFPTIFAEGRDVPPERSAHLVLLLASGRADHLSGRFFMNEEDLLAQIDSAPS
jgi:NAD(P)-dependent dehydrogenase (short-subunit alcohol dehydrogenase family)